MGFITTLTANNDFFDELKRAAENGMNVGLILYDALLRISSTRPVHVPVAGITIVETHHADLAQPVLVGGGREAHVIDGINIFYTDMEPELTLLKQLAEKYGFVIYKKPPPGVGRKQR